MNEGVELTDPLPAESPEEKIARYEGGLKAIAACPLNGLDFGDYVQAVIHDLLEGLDAECYKCGTAVHEGDCVDPDEDNGGPAFRFIAPADEGWMNRPHAYHDPDPQQPTGCVCRRPEGHPIHA